MSKIRLIRLIPLDSLPLQLVAANRLTTADHAPNENFEWAQAADGMAAFARVIEEWGAVSGRR